MLDTELILEHCTALIARKVAEQIRVTEKPSFEKRLFTVEEAAEYLGRSAKCGQAHGRSRETAGNEDLTCPPKTQPL